MPEPDDIVRHDVSLAAWNLPSPVIAGGRVALIVGISCTAGCNLAGTCLELGDESGRTLGSSNARPTVWPATRSLYWTEIDVPAPETDGDRVWILRAPFPASPHHPAITSVRLIVAGRPDHRITIQVVEKESAKTLNGVAVRLGPFRAITDHAGMAQLAVPAGTYQLSAWKLGYDLPTQEVHLHADASVQLDATPAPVPEEPYWM